MTQLKLISDFNIKWIKKLEVISYFKNNNSININYLFIINIITNNKSK